MTVFLQLRADVPISCDEQTEYASQRIADRGDCSMHHWLAKGTVLLTAALTVAGCCKRGTDVDPKDLGLDDPGTTGAGSTPTSENVEASKRAALGKLPAPSGPAIPANKEAGPAYFGTQGGTLVKLEDGTFSRAFSKLGWLKDIAIGADATLWVASSTNLHQIRGKTKKSFRGSGKARQFDEIALGKDGTVWLTGLYGVTRFKDGKWKTFEKNEIHPELKGSVGSIAVDDKGRVWLVSTQLIAVFEADKWTTVSTKGAPGSALFCHGAVLRDQALYTIADGGLVKIAGDEWQTLRSSKRLNGNELALGPDGTFLVADYDSVTRVKVGSALEEYAKGVAFKGKTLRNLFADAQGRAWFTTDAGLTVIDATGKTMQWVQGTESLLAEKVSAIFVQGSGPTLPSSTGTVKTGTVKGKLTRGSAAAANLPVEICPSPSMMYDEGSSPCGESDVHKSAQTGADGSFVFSDVPVGGYGIAYKAGPKWTITMGSRYCAKMKEGGTCTIPAIDVNR